MSSEDQSTLAAHISKVLGLDSAAVAVEYQGAAVTWGELARCAAEIERCLAAAGIDRSAPIGWAARNRPGAVAAFVALAASGRMIVPLRPNYATAAFRDDIRAQRLQAVIGDPEDWAGDGVIEAAQEAGSLGIEVAGPPLAVRLHPELAEPGLGPYRAAAPGFVLERLTSGTTGAPKRIPVREDVLIPSLRSGEQKRPGEQPEPLRLKKSPALLFKPFSHAGGLFGLLLSLYQARPIVLFEKFKVDDWVAAVRKYRPQSASLVPAMIRMLLEAEIDLADLSSLRAIRSGTAPLEPEIQEAFEARFGVPILIDYGAAEFIGGLAGWSLDDYRAFGKVKRGSVGRARPDVAIRVVDQAARTPQPAGEIGIVEIRSDRYGPDWISTNDLASIDADGFVFLRGRADDAINRGGFKILPEEVAAVLRQHPDIADAAVIGAPDARLGQVPVAAIEVSAGAQAPDGKSLSAFLRERLPAYMVPVEYHVLAELPRTASLKINRPALKQLLGLA